MTDKIEFKLEDPINVHAEVNGANDFIDLETLYLQAPNYKHKDKTIPLKKDFLEALFGMTSSVNKDDAQSMVDDASSEEQDDKLEAKAIKAILYASKGFNIVEFFNKFERFLSSKICFKDEECEQSIKLVELQKLSESDQENLIAKYIEVFFIVSWMKTLK